MKWFKHSTNASDDEFLSELEDIFGLEGYARWWKLLETIAAQMDGTDKCSASYSWTKWQTFLKGKRNKLETFLKHLENKRKINLKQTGNILEISCRKLLELRDEHTRKLRSKTGVTPEQDRELELDKEEEVKEKPSSEGKENPPNGETPPPPDKKSKPRKTKTKLAEDFTPPDEWGDYAVSKGFSAREVAEMWQKFRAHHLANGSVFLCWKSAWHTWILRQLEINQRQAKRDAR